MLLDLNHRDTIVAQGSGKGRSALGIVRLSGPQTPLLLAHFFDAKMLIEKPSSLFRRTLCDEKKHMVDDVMAVYFAPKKSFTGEESAEIYCHGNPLIISEILRLACHFGARLAMPGEFSRRAMLNGKLNLAEAESIADLIHARSLEAKQAALLGLKGGLFDKTKNAREILIGVLAEIEARMDFPDEDLGSYDGFWLSKKILLAVHEIDMLLQHAGRSLKLHEGMRIVICGAPNAGKSTLLNRLVGEDKAIVHADAGTTRDVIECHLILQGMPVVLLDVAGIREAHQACSVEQIGIEKAFYEIEKADGIIWLWDACCEHPFADDEFLQKLKGVHDRPVLKVINKIELNPVLISQHDVLTLSAKTGEGVDKLFTKLHEIAAMDDAEEGDLVITRTRQKEELITAKDAFLKAHEALGLGLADEIITSELRLAGCAFDRLFGTNLSEDVLDKIFSEFCIGK